MDWNERVRRAFEGHPPPEDDVVDELAQHAASIYQEARAEGCAPAEAERRLQDQLSAWSRNASTLARRPRRAPVPAPPTASSSIGLRAWASSWLHDLKYAVRIWRHDRGHALLVITTMAMGIAVATVLFSVLYGVLLKPLPWVDADRLIRLYETREGATRPPMFFTNVTYLAWQTHPKTIDGLGGWQAYTRTVEAGGETERVMIASATPWLFDVLGSRPEVGVAFSSRNGLPDDEREILLSHGYWVQRFGGGREAIGRTLRIDGDAYRVVGVMPASFSFPVREVRLFVPLSIKPIAGPEPGMRTLSMFAGVARLRTGVSPAQAAAEATARGRGGPDAGPVAVAVFGSNGAVKVTAVPFLDSIAGEVRPALIVFMVAVALLVLTATANVASLQMARAVARRREVALRSAVGAGHGRLARQLLTESLVLGVLGGALGLAAAAWLRRALPYLLPADFPRISDIAIDWRVALFSLGLALLTSLAFGLFPALHARRVDLVSALNEDALAPVGGSMRTPVARARAAIMACEIAVAGVLLVGAALLGRSFLAMIHADRGYDPSGVLTARLVLPDHAFTPAARAETLRALLERLRDVPGVRRAAFTTSLPLVGGEMLSSFPMRSPRTGAQMQIQAAQYYVSPDYFPAMGIALAQGRGFSERDSATSSPVVVVNQAFVRRYLDDTPLDEHIPVNVRGVVTAATIIGVIADVRQHGMTDQPLPELYKPYPQITGGLTHDLPMLVLRTEREPASLVPDLRRVVRDTAPHGVLENIVSMEERIREDLARPRLYAVLLGVFAAFAVIIAAVGLFGVLAYTVAQRAREIGVRTALGASPRSITMLVLKQAASVTAAGLAVGVAIAYVVVRSLSALLYGIEPRDAVSFGAGAALLLIVSVVASIIPARRAATVDPLKVLR